MIQVGGPFITIVMVSVAKAISLIAPFIEDYTCDRHGESILQLQNNIYPVL